MTTCATFSRVTAASTHSTDTVSQVFHTLSQPLTELHGRLEMALVRDLNAGEMRTSICNALAAVDRVIASLCFLRDLAEAEQPGIKESVDLSSTFLEVFEDFHLVAEDRQIEVQVVKGRALWVQADSRRLSRALTLIVDSVLATSPRRVLLEPVEGGLRLSMTGANLHSANDAQFRSLELARRLLEAAQCELRLQDNEVIVACATAIADAGTRDSSGTPS